MPNYSVCNACKEKVPAHHEKRQGKVWLVKECGRCGRTETLVSSNAARWRAKRAIMGAAATGGGCDFRCRLCDHPVAPQTIFLDITNRCDLDCPICIANVPHMGFRFEPPLAYFEKIFNDLARRQPVPSVKLFGGEPVVRRDLPDIVRLAHARGIPVAVVTNGIGLANEERCRRLLETGARLIFAFDGFDPDTYRLLRDSARALDLKLKALENVRKYRKAKITLMCVLAKGINDREVPKLLRFCHERQDFINALQFIPLTMTWEPGTVEAERGAITAMEDVEDIIAASVPGGELEFLPAGLVPCPTLGRYFNLSRSTFAGAHPNCESMTFLISNGKEYVPVRRYLKTSLYQAVAALIAADRRLARRLARLEHHALGRLALAAGADRLLALATAARWFFTHVRLHDILGPDAGARLGRIASGLLRGTQLKTLLKQNLAVGNLLFIVVLPFEEPRTLESERLVRCPAAFAYEDPDTRQVRTMPVCAWCLHKDDILRRIQALYPVAAAAADAP